MFLFVRFAFLPRAREGKKDNSGEEGKSEGEREDKKETEDNAPTMAEQLQAAERELQQMLQRVQELPLVLRSGWWMTKEGEQVKRHVEETCHQLANRMAEECGRFRDSYPDGEIAQTSPPSPLQQEEIAENEAVEEAAEVLVLEEVTGKDGVC